MEDIIGILVKSYELESSLKVESSAGLDNLEKAVEKLGASKWDRVKKLARDDGESVLDHGRRKALILIYAHLLRISITDSALQKGVGKTDFSWTYYSSFLYRASEDSVTNPTPSQRPTCCFLITKLANIDNVYYASTGAPRPGTTAWRIPPP